MKRQDFIKEVSKLGEKELKIKLASLHEELLNMRFKQASNSIEKPHLIKETRKKIAILNTFYTQSLANQKVGTNE